MDGKMGQVTGERSKSEILKERLLYAVGKYSDYSRYKECLDNLEEEYDETLELYNFDIWFNISEGTIRDKASEMLRVTSELFEDLKNNAARELFYVMREISEMDKGSQEEICGVVIPKELFTEAEFFGMLSELTEYEYCQNEALEAYLQVLKEWAEKSDGMDGAGKHTG